jgi:hypothetical protein
MLHETNVVAADRTVFVSMYYVYSVSTDNIFLGIYEVQYKESGIRLTDPASYTAMAYLHTLQITTTPAKSSSSLCLHEPFPDSGF